MTDIKENTEKTVGCKYCWISEVARNDPYLHFTMEFDVESKEDKDILLEHMRGMYKIIKATIELKEENSNEQESE